MLGYPLQPVPGGWWAHVAGVIVALFVSGAFAFNDGGHVPSGWPALLIFVVVFFPVRAITYRLIERRWLKRKMREIEAAGRDVG